VDDNQPKSTSSERRRDSIVTAAAKAPGTERQNNDGPRKFAIVTARADRSSWRDHDH